MSDPALSLGAGTHPLKKGVCSRCGKTVRYKDRYDHGCLPYSHKKPQGKDA